jgi:hypothetical protein
VVVTFVVSVSASLAGFCHEQTRCEEGVEYNRVLGVAWRVTWLATSLLMLPGSSFASTLSTSMNVVENDWKQRL